MRHSDTFDHPREFAAAELTTVERRFFLLGLISRAQAIGLHDPGWILLSQHLNLVNVEVHQYQAG